jgi:hypothetical protein
MMISGCFSGSQEPDAFRISQTVVHADDGIGHITITPVPRAMSVAHGPIMATIEATGIRMTSPIAGTHAYGIDIQTPSGAWSRFDGIWISIGMTDLTSLEFVDRSGASVARSVWVHGRGATAPWIIPAGGATLATLVSHRPITIGGP